MCIALITGYIISREGTDDTLKNILTVPLSFPALLAGKLAVCGLLSTSILGGGGENREQDGQQHQENPCPDHVIPFQFPNFSFQQYQHLNLPLSFYTAGQSPRIPNGHLIGAVVAFVYGYGGMFAAGNMTLANVYPVTASMGLIGYRSYDAAVHWKDSSV